MKSLNVLILIFLSFATLSILHRVTGDTDPANATSISDPAIGSGKGQEPGLLIGE
jgi:hypothetical protein